MTTEFNPLYSSTWDKESLKQHLNNIVPPVITLDKTVTLDETITINDTVIEETKTITIDSSADNSKEKTEKTDNTSEEATKSIQQDFTASCPVHDHHRDDESICPDDPTCTCLQEA